MLVYLFGPFTIPVILFAAYKWYRRNDERNGVNQMIRDRQTRDAAELAKAEDAGISRRAAKKTMRQAARREARAAYDKQRENTTYH